MWILDKNNTWDQFIIKSDIAMIVVWITVSRTNNQR